MLKKQLAAAMDEQVYTVLPEIEKPSQFLEEPGGGIRRGNTLNRSDQSLRDQSPRNQSPSVINPPD